MRVAPSPWARIHGSEMTPSSSVHARITGADCRMTIGPDARYRALLEHLAAHRGQDLSELELERIRTTLAVIPHDVSTVVDVGCGDGRIVGRLPACVNTVGVDYSSNALHHFEGNGVCARSEFLPFRDRSVDLALCCEVLEHLPDEMFRRTLHELGRISRKYILISVPYRETLRRGYVRCPACLTIFHVWGHLRRFTRRTVKNLFPDFTVSTTTFVGKRPPYHLGPVIAVNQRYGNRWAEWDEMSICPRCGNTLFERTPRNLITMACGVINMLTSCIIPVSQRNWILTLFVRARP